LATLFRENGIDHDKVNYFNEPFTADRLRELIKKTVLRPFAFLRKGESIAKELGLGAETPDDDLIRLMIENPNLLQRPIVEVGDKAVLARPIEKALDLIKG
jgi:arsenate reductase